MEPASGDSAQLIERIERLRKQGDAKGAIELALPAAQQAGARPRLVNELALAYAESDDFQQAANWFTRSLATSPRQPRTLARFAFVLVELGRYEEARQASEQALKLEPDLPGAYQQLGSALTGLGQWDAALSALDSAINLNPKDASIELSRSNLLRKRGRLAEALASVDRSLALEAGAGKGQMHRAFVLAEMGEIDRAIAAADGAARTRPGDPFVTSVKGEFLLLKGDYPAGWALFESRWKTRARSVHRGGEHVPVWDGASPIESKRVLLVPEVGLGDYLMFVRYAELLAQRGATPVIWAPAPLVPLFNASFHYPVVSADAPQPGADLRCPIMGLPHRFGTTVETVPCSIPYLAADPGRVEAWQELLGPRKRMRVGLSWWGSKGRGVDSILHKKRSVPLAALAPLWELPVDFHSLQAETSDEELPALRSSPVIDHSQRLTDFGETAALMAGMDLVISIDTSVAHAAGALGRPLWVVLPQYSDYRWGGTRGASPWYPAARLFRQSVAGDWQHPIAAARAALEALQAS